MRVPRQARAFRSDIRTFLIRDLRKREPSNIAAEALQSQGTTQERPSTERRRFLGKSNLRREESVIGRQ